MKFSVTGQANTPVPTVFLKKYLCDAPQDYVKVYLFGLCLAYTGEQMGDIELEEALHLSGVQIEAALKYWETKGFVFAKSAGRTVSYEFLSGEEERVEEKPRKKPPIYEYEGYNNMLNTLLNRTLSPVDLQKIYDFTDVFGLPQDVVITLVEYCVTGRGSNVSVAYLDKVAQAWADEGVDSREKAQQKIEEYKAMSGGAKIVMKQMGLLGKNPGKTEMDYYTKWTEKWGFTHEAVLFAMRDKEFAKDQPFKYLDAILRTLYEQGITSSRKISEYNASRSKRQANIKEVLGALEYSRLNVTPKYEKFYDEWETAGYTHAIILLACMQSKNNGSRKFESVDSLLGEWREKGLNTEEEIKKYMRQQNTVEKRIKQVYDCAGIKKMVGDADRKFYLYCINDAKMSHDVLMYAAEISSIANEPASFLRKVLADWSKSRVTTLEQAMTQNLNRFSGDIKNKKTFEQHRYSAEDKEKRKADIIRDMEQLYEE